MTTFRKESGKNRIKPWHIILIIAIPVLGFSIMYGLAYLLPIASDLLPQLLFTVLLIGLGLAVPYWFLKLGAHEAHRNNPEEKELTLKEIPKDKDDLDAEPPPPAIPPGPASPTERVERF